MSANLEHRDVILYVLLIPAMCLSCKEECARNWPNTWAKFDALLTFGGPKKLYRMFDKKRHPCWLWVQYGRKERKGWARPSAIQDAGIPED